MITKTKFALVAYDTHAASEASAKIWERLVKLGVKPDWPWEIPFANWFTEQLREDSSWFNDADERITFDAVRAPFLSSVHGNPFRNDSTFTYDHFRSLWTRRSAFATALAMSGWSLYGIQCPGQMTTHATRVHPNMIETHVRDHK